MRTLTLTLSKTEFELDHRGRLHYKVLEAVESDPSSVSDENGSSKKPLWWNRFLALRGEGLTYVKCADTLNREGYVSKTNKRISETTLAVLFHYHTKKRG